MSIERTVKILDAMCFFPWMYNSKSESEQVWGSNFEDGTDSVVLKNGCFFLRDPATGIDTPTSEQIAFSTIEDIYQSGMQVGW